MIHVVTQKNGGSLYGLGTESRRSITNMRKQEGLSYLPPPSLYLIYIYNFFLRKKDGEYFYSLCYTLKVSQIYTFSSIPKRL